MQIDPRGIALLPLLLAACDCPTFARMEVRDPRGLASEAQVEMVREAIDVFAAATGLDGVCVEGIRLRDGPGGGVCRGPGTWLRLDVGPHYDLTTMATHELCHAWDREAGDPSLAHPDLFPADAVPVTIGHLTAHRRSREQLAIVRSAGPRDVRVPLALQERCGLDLVGDDERWVQENVYVAWPGVSESVAPVPVTLTAVPLPVTGAGGGMPTDPDARRRYASRS